MSRKCGRNTEENYKMKSIKVEHIEVFALGAGVKGASRKIKFQVGVKADIAFVHLDKRDPRKPRMRKVIRLFNEALIEARRLNLPIDGVPVVLRGILEEDPSPYFSGVVGEFWLQYGAFESKFGTRGSGTREKMLSLYSDEGVPLPYDVRNWLGHIGSQPLDKFSLSDVTSSCNLLRKWNSKNDEN